MLILYDEGLLAPHPTSELEDHPLSFVCGCIFGLFASTLHCWRPSLRPHPEDAPCCRMFESAPSPLPPVYGHRTGNWHVTSTYLINNFNCCLKLPSLESVKQEMLQLISEWWCTVCVEKGFIFTL
jgi:hypothetical protein